MSRFKVATRVAALAAALLAPVDAAVFIVDVNNGPGTHFLQIQPAIDAASPGDVLIVRAGYYRAFTLTKGISIVAEKFLAPDIVVVDPGCVIRGVPAGEKALLKEVFLGNLKILDCAGLVAADVLMLTPPSTLLGPGDTSVLEIRHCADVRMRQFGINPGNGSGRDGVVVANARFEVDGASIDGARGPAGASGGAGIRCEAGAAVQVSFSQVRGGEVGAGGPTAGTAIAVAHGAHVAVNGTIENRIVGGWGGLCGQPGPAFFVDQGATARVSHMVRVEGGIANCRPAAPRFAGQGAVTIADPADLAMVFEGGIAAVGVPARLAVLGEPDAVIVLLAGLDPRQQPAPPFRGNALLLSPVIAAPMGAIPGTGQLFAELRIPAGAPPGVGVLLQVASVRTTGEFFLSNSTLLVSR